MGAYLSAPVTEKAEDGGEAGPGPGGRPALRFGVSSMQVRPPPPPPPPPTPHTHTRSRA